MVNSLMVGSLLIRLIGYMVYRIYGQFWLDKTLDHISGMQCTTAPNPEMLTYFHES